MLDLDGTFSGFVTALFGLINELLRNVFSFLTDFLNGIHISVG